MNQSYNFIFRPATGSASGKWIEETAINPSGGQAVTIIGPPTSPLEAGAGADVIADLLNFGAGQPNGLLTASVISGNGKLVDGEAPTDFFRGTVDQFGSGVDEAAQESALAAYTNSMMMARVIGADGIFPVEAYTADGTSIANDAFALSTASLGYGFDGGSNWDALRTASATNQAAATKTAPLQIATPGTWSITHAPAANTQATISRAAGAAGVRHICTAITATLVAPAAIASGAVQVNLRDGATGAGTILKSFTLQVGGAASISADHAIIQLSGLQIVGSAATAMTLEFSAAGGASTLESVSLEGYDIN